MAGTKSIFSTPSNDENKTKIAEFFGISESEINNYEVSDTYIINIKNNEYAQTQYKVIVPFGNGNRPNTYNFDQNLLVRWNGTKIQPA